MAGVDILATAMTGANAAYLADLYARWTENPGSVDPTFAELFASLNDEARAVLTDASGASWAPRIRGAFGPDPEKPVPANGAKPGAAARGSGQGALSQARRTRPKSLQGISRITQK